MISVSPMAIVEANKGRVKRAKIGGMVIHTTGSGLTSQAAAKGRDANEYAVEHYKNAGEYPHYLITHDGKIHSFCDELMWAAHAKWDDNEKVYYQGPEDWKNIWVNTAAGNINAQPVNPDFYKDWVDRWGSRFHSPLEMIESVGGDLAGPNRTYVGVEVLDAKPFNQDQLASLARLCLDVFDRHGLNQLKTIFTVPQPWLCGHSDISPIRRWARKSNGSGFPYDPSPSNLDWQDLSNRLAASGSAT